MHLVCILKFVGILIKCTVVLCAYIVLNLYKWHWTKDHIFPLLNSMLCWRDLSLLLLSTGFYFMMPIHYILLNDFPSNGPQINSISFMTQTVSSKHVHPCLSLDLCKDFFFWDYPQVEFWVLSTNNHLSKPCLSWSPGYRISSHSHQ